ncbi:uncharacterized protein SPPG_02795 [Spizellomyces punctatus DAOM BR117]|uniref:C2H2-type domain-containing protein n=1 Tax=Spizellomyces punctatus (strain DAOM BR117) TaxID=645134 RepID=A0A0L0HLL1_SPIPD|nr:uncharacterized protein SPPG_02795 [Spizellomyces punctatus DAOM BR117]KND02321.1 hypothetical protein SPPG_02795 [Spizellomyces punctatus DAOM BR117]|eukprot:XP_016610360.1 hypothetical protein SPPG_02795 [Spizellomyces punctatus DAOM BR117]
METWHGFVETLEDAVLLLEACRQGYLRRNQRRLTENEKVRIQSGSVWIWDEEEAQIRRWTDGRTWSPSRRLLERFLIYYEIDGAARNRRTSEETNSTHEDGDVSMYKRKEGGLCKRCLAVTTTDGRRQHLVAYYSEEDARSGKLPRPSQQPDLASVFVDYRRYPDIVLTWTDSSPSMRSHMQELAKRHQNRAGSMPSSGSSHRRTHSPDGPSQSTRRYQPYAFGPQAPSSSQRPFSASQRGWKHHSSNDVGQTYASPAPRHVAPSSYSYPMLPQCTDVYHKAQPNPQPPCTRSCCRPLARPNHFPSHSPLHTSSAYPPLAPTTTPMSLYSPHTPLPSAYPPLATTTAPMSRYSPHASPPSIPPAPAHQPSYITTSKPNTRLEISPVRGAWSNHLQLPLPQAGPLVRQSTPRIGRPIPVAALLRETSSTDFDVPLEGKAATVWKD